VPTDAPDLLAGAIERAIVRARRDTTDRDAPAPPAALRPVLGFQRLPPRALRTVAEVLDRDEGFRARVAEGLEPDQPDRPSWLFLTRPDGWADELDMLGDGAAEQRAEKERRSAERRVEQLSAALDRRGEELDEQRAEAESARAELADERRRRQDAERALAASDERSGSLGEERARAVRELKRIEALATERLDLLRAAEGEVAGLRAELDQHRSAQIAPDDEPVPPVADEAPGSGPPFPLSEVAATVEVAARSADELAAALGDVARLLASFAAGPGEQQSPGPTAVPGASAPSPGATPSAAPATRPSRRVPLRTQRGVVEDSPKGIEQLMATDGLVTLVDGYNVAMSRWPDLDKGAQRDSLIRSLGAVAARVGAVVHVVFDGGDHGRRPSVGAPLPVRVHFSPTGVEADDVILDMVAELPTDTAVLVISSDRRVAQGSRRLGANTAGSDALIGLLAR
jgi:hypothetical protein